MAQVLEEYDFKLGRAAGHEKYPWSDWFDGRIWQLDPHVEETNSETGEVTVTGDFPGKASDFRTTCYSAADRHKIKIRTSVLPNGGLVLCKVGVKVPKPA